MLFDNRRPIAGKSFGGIVEGFVRAGQTGLNGAVDVFSGVVKGGTAIGGSIASGVTSTITGAVVQSAESLNDIGNTIRQTIESAINPIKSGFATSLRGLLDFLRERFPFLGSLVGRFASGGAGGSGRGGTSASVGGTAGVGTKKGRGGLGLSLGM